MHLLRLGRPLLGLALALLLGSPAAPARAEDEAPPARARRAMLWVSKAEPRVYVFGTLGVPDARAQAPPRTVQEAMGECYVYLADLPAGDDDLARLEAQARRLSALPPEVGGLRKLLGDGLHARVAALISSSTTINTLESREPWYVRREVLRAQLARAYPHPVKLLAHDLWDRARLEGLPVAGLDTAPEYMEVFDGLTLEEQVAWLQATVEHFEKEQKSEVKQHERLVQAYLAGDEAKVQATWRESLPGGKLGEKLAAALIRDRVRRMLERFTARRKREPDLEIFLALEARLLAGESGALAGLARQGIELRRAD